MGNRQSNENGGDGRDGGSDNLGASRASIHGEEDTVELIRKLVTIARIALPKQAILENFVHHNPWEILQDMDFLAANHLVETWFDILSPGERCFHRLGADPRYRAHAAVVDLCVAFTDRGVAKWEAPYRERGFLYFFAQLEDIGIFGKSWRSHAVEQARDLLRQMDAAIENRKLGFSEYRAISDLQLSEKIIHENLSAFGATLDRGNLTPDVVKYAQDTLRSMMMDLNGWSGMFERMEMHPVEAPRTSKAVTIPVRIIDFAAVLSILLRSSMQAMCEDVGFLDIASCIKPMPTSKKMLTKVRDGRDRLEKKDIEADGEKNELPFNEATLQSPSSLAYLDQNATQRIRLEEEYEDMTLREINELGQFTSSRPQYPSRNPTEQPPPADLQLFTCIDERECSFRRRAEEAEEFCGITIETFGVAGFFDFPLRFESFDGLEQAILAPEGSVVDYVLKEIVMEEDEGKGKHYLLCMKIFASIEVMWERLSFSPIATLFLAVLFPISVLRLVFMCYSPQLYRKLKAFCLETIAPKPRTTFHTIPFSNEDAANRLARTFQNIGLGERSFSPMIVVLGHGSRTVNNPFDAAHNCGACGGREGGPNARLLCRLANNADVRKILREKHEIAIPDGTHFVGGFHDTSSDLVDVYDTETVPEELQDLWKKVECLIYRARACNAAERCGKFLLWHGNRYGEDLICPEVEDTEAHAQSGVVTAEGGSQISIDTTTGDLALAYAHTKSTDLGEARPELGHATNASVILGRRELTKGLFLARRAFLPSYDPFSDNNEGTNLERVIAPALIVCSGISLEYLYSTVEGGAGTKVVMNLVGYHGVMQGVSGDLLVGLPTQMTELHSPLRALYLIDAPVARVQAVLNRRPELKKIVTNNWVRFFVRDPRTGVIHRHTEDNQYAPMIFPPRLMRGLRPTISEATTAATNGTTGNGHSLNQMPSTSSSISPPTNTGSLSRFASPIANLSPGFSILGGGNSNHVNNLSLKAPLLATGPMNTLLGSNIGPGGTNITYSPPLSPTIGNGNTHTANGPTGTTRGNGTETPVMSKKKVDPSENRIENPEMTIEKKQTLPLPRTTHFKTLRVPNFHHTLQHALGITAREFKVVLVCLAIQSVSIVFPLFLFDVKHIIDDENLYTYDTATDSFIISFFDKLTVIHPRSNYLVMGGTFLGITNMTFSRRYLHGEFMFDRCMLNLSTLIAGFNIVATAPTLAFIVSGWTLLGFAAVFLIGCFNDRPTVRANASYVFAVYQLSDVAILVAAILVAMVHYPHDYVNKNLTATFLPDRWAFPNVDVEIDPSHPYTHSVPRNFIALCLLICATTKTSQFPFVSLFARSMEGTSPSSAIVEGAISAHVGIVLLSGTSMLWFPFMWCRVLLVTIGFITAVYSGSVAHIRADRKGGLAYAISGTVGALYMVVAAGYFDISLLLAFGHACLRMVQILRAHNGILEYHQLSAALKAGTEEEVAVRTGSKEAPGLTGQNSPAVYKPHHIRTMIDSKPTSPLLYQMVWVLHRVAQDSEVPTLLHKLQAFLRLFSSSPSPLSLFSRFQSSNNVEWLSRRSQHYITFIFLGLCGVPFIPWFGNVREELVGFALEFCSVQTLVLVLLLIVVLTSSIIWWLFSSILDRRRFLYTQVPKTS